MSTSFDPFADEEGDIEVIDLPKPDFNDLVKEYRISEIGHIPGYWGDLSVYTDDDFNHLMPRLIVASLVVFVKSANAQENPCAKIAIQNTSNLPMTYSVQDFHEPCEMQNPKIRVAKPAPGWIPPKSSALLNIRIDVDEDIKSPNVSIHFALHAVPIFRKKHTQKENLELLWKGFDSEYFPRSHAEEHVFTIYISGYQQRGFRPYISSMDDYKLYTLRRVKPPKNFRNNQGQISQEEFNALWVAGEDPHEYKFALELRVRELNRVMKCAEGETGAMLAQERQTWLLALAVILMFFFLFVVDRVIMHNLNKEDDDY